MDIVTYALCKKRIASSISALKEEYDNRCKDCCKVKGITVNGTAVEPDENGIVDILSCTMGRDFTTDITVGHLEAGTKIYRSDTPANILYRILYGPTEEEEEKITLYFGASDEVPIGINNLDFLVTKANLNKNDLVDNGFEQIVKTGNEITGTGQYGVIVCPKSIKVSNIAVKDAESISIDYNFEQNENYNIYYIPTRTYDEDLGGIDYIFNFVEGA